MLGIRSQPCTYIHLRSNGRSPSPLTSIGSVRPPKSIHPRCRCRNRTVCGSLGNRWFNQSFNSQRLFFRHLMPKILVNTQSIACVFWHFWRKTFSLIIAIWFNHRLHKRLNESYYSPSQVYLVCWNNSTTVFACQGFLKIFQPAAAFGSSDAFVFILCFSIK